MEVKTRLDNENHQALLAVTKSKQNKIIKTAYKYIELKKHNLQPRFDVCEVCVKDRKVFVNYIENAF